MTHDRFVSQLKRPRAADDAEVQFAGATIYRLDVRRRKMDSSVISQATGDRLPSPRSFWQMIVDIIEAGGYFPPPM